MVSHPLLTHVTTVAVAATWTMVPQHCQPSLAKIKNARDPPCPRYHKFSHTPKSGKRGAGSSLQKTLSKSNGSGLVGGGRYPPSTTRFSQSQPTKVNLAPCSVVIIRTLLHSVQYLLGIGLSAGGERSRTRDRRARPILTRPWPSSSTLSSLLAWSQHCLIVGWWCCIPTWALAKP